MAALLNFQLGMSAAIALVALECDEGVIKSMYLILIFTTLGAFRVIQSGVKVLPPSLASRAQCAGELAALSPYEVKAGRQQRPCCSRCQCERHDCNPPLSPRVNPCVTHLHHSLWNDRMGLSRHLGRQDGDLQ